MNRAAKALTCFLIKISRQCIPVLQVFVLVKLVRLPHKVENDRANSDFISSDGDLGVKSISC